MYLRSTGLGRTLLKARVEMLGVTHLVPSTLKESKSEKARMIMVIKVEEPVHWEVEAFMESQDLRRLIRLILKPSTIFYGLKLLFSKSQETVLQPVKEVESIHNEKFASAERKEKRQVANVPLSPAQKAALKKKKRKSMLWKDLESAKVKD